MYTYVEKDDTVEVLTEMLDVTTQKAAALQGQLFERGMVIARVEKILEDEKAMGIAEKQVATKVEQKVILLQEKVTQNDAIIPGLEEIQTGEKSRQAAAQLAEKEGARENAALKERLSEMEQDVTARREQVIEKDAIIQAGLGKIQSEWESKQAALLAEKGLTTKDETIATLEDLLAVTENKVNQLQKETEREIGANVFAVSGVKDLSRKGRMLKNSNVRKDREISRL